MLGCSASRAPGAARPAAAPLGACTPPIQSRHVLPPSRLSSRRAGLFRSRPSAWGSWALGIRSLADQACLAPTPSRRHFLCQTQMVPSPHLKTAVRWQGASIVWGSLGSSRVLPASPQYPQRFLLSDAGLCSQSGAVWEAGWPWVRAPQAETAGAQWPGAFMGHWRPPAVAALSAQLCLHAEPLRVALEEPCAFMSPSPTAPAPATATLARHFFHLFFSFCC